MLPYHVLPHLNALLNGASAVLLLAGYVCIRKKSVAFHRVCMISAVATSLIFLASYVIYHSQVGSVRFRHYGWVRPVYFTILVSHTFLAISLAPLVTITLRRALKNSFDLHRKIARWTLPIWFYVSVTGVIVYLMLYHL
jgi:uncharacterized membrane protein YozB (DUF420 family)